MPGKLLYLLQRIGILLALILVGPFEELHAQQLWLTVGTDLSGLNNGYQFEQKGDVLNRGWKNKKGRYANGKKYAMNVSLYYRVTPSFALETGARFFDVGITVHDTRFMNSNSITGAPTKNNINGTYSDAGEFNFVEWYLSQYVSAHFLFRPRARLRPYATTGIAYNYFASRHAEISNEFTSSSTGENLQLTAQYAPHYWSGFLESGICFRVRDSENRGPLFFAGLRYTLAGKAVSANYQDIQSGNLVYNDHLTATGSYWSLSMRIGGLLSKPTM
jgi:hypothetical protein